MSQIKQYGARGPLSDPPILGEYIMVTYADHLAALRACEQRMREEHRHRCSVCYWCYSDGALEALDAARKAVSALPEYRMRDTCIAAIEQLREERK